MTFNWNCKTVDVYPVAEGNSNVVYNVHWVVTGVSTQTDENGENYSARSIGTQVLSTENITEFTPLENLTNEQITGWVKDAMGAEQVAQIEENLNNQIADKITPKSVTVTIE